MLRSSCAALFSNKFSRTRYVAAPITGLYYAVEGASKDGAPFDRVAQCTLAVSALVTATGFLAYGMATVRFYNSLENSTKHSLHAEQLERLFKMSRIIVVSVICTVCFAMRALLVRRTLSLRFCV